MDEEIREGVRLQVYMARCGVASRRKCEELIAQGTVKVDGRTVKVMGYLVSEGQEVTCNGRKLFPVKKHVYIALNKPTGYLCSNYDGENRPLAVDLLKGVYNGRLYNVGRLDFLSSGLIFFTNDGEFTRKVSHPSSRIEKEYVVETREEISEEFLQQCKKGLTVEGVHYRIQHYKRKTPNKVHLVLTEGKNREIRNLFMHQRMKIKKLHRIRIGSVNIKGIPQGQYRYLSVKEIDSLMGGSKA